MSRGEYSTLFNQVCVASGEQKGQMLPLFQELLSNIN